MCCVVVFCELQRSYAVHCVLSARVRICWPAACVYALQNVISPLMLAHDAVSGPPERELRDFGYAC